MVTLERERENNTSLLHRLSGSSATFTFFRRAAQLSCSVVILVAQPVGVWDKANNWRIAGIMTEEELDETDLGKFLKSL